MRKKIFRIIGLTLIVLALTAVCVVVLLPHVDQLLGPRKCMRARMMVPMGDTFANVGNLEICGYDMSFSNLYGPSFEVFIDILKRDNKDLKEELKQCVSQKKEGREVVINVDQGVK